MAQASLAVILYTICFGAIFPALGVAVVVNGDLNTVFGVAVVFLLMTWFMWVSVGVFGCFTGGLVEWLADKLWFLMPTLTLYMTAQVMPRFLTVDGLFSPIAAGLILLGAVELSWFAVGQHKR
jgi:hypothetical protein